MKSFEPIFQEKDIEHSELEELDLEIFGRVQGVGFRDMIKRAAEKEGLKGFVQNRNDGSVSLVVQGSRVDLQQFSNWINSSPGMSKIESVNSRWRVAKKVYPEFRIVRDKAFLRDQASGIINLGKNLAGKETLRVPKHIAIIPDGNRRWAKEKGLEGSFGHYKAANYNNIRALFRAGKKLGVKYMSLWGFSTENWKRNEKEIETIFSVISDNVTSFREDAHHDKIRFRHIGRKDRMPRKLAEDLERLEEETKGYSEFNVQLCLDYGGRDEIVRAVNQILQSGGVKTTEEELSMYLDSFDIPDPDMIIRTGGEKRLSGFMPMQSVYAELYFSDEYFPDFGPAQLEKAVEEFSVRQRRFGGDGE